jgi:hypothetical protein
MRRTAYAELVVEALPPSSPTYLLTGMHGNVGDHLIWAGMERLLISRGVAFTRIAQHAVATIEAPEATLLVPGSGAWSTRWHEWLPALVSRAATSFGRVVVAASSYDPSVTVVEEALAKPNVFAFAREPASYRAIRRWGRANLGFDPALYYFPFDRERAVAPLSDSPKALVALRTDSGSLLADQGLLPNPAVNNDISVTTRSLNDFLESVRQAELVITDRLHVAVASLGLGRHLCFVDPYDKKISTYLDFVFRDEFSDLAQRRDEGWLVENNLAMESRSA